MNNIKWFYHYIEKCNEVTSEEVINTVPDKFGRWQLRGKIEVETKFLVGYEKLGKTIYLPIATIEFTKNRGFHCNFKSLVDANIWFSNKLIRGEAPNEVMKLVEKELDNLIKIFKSLK